MWHKATTIDPFPSPTGQQKDRRDTRVPYGIRGTGSHQVGQNRSRQGACWGSAEKLCLIICSLSRRRGARSRPTAPGRVSARARPGKASRRPKSRSRQRPGFWVFTAADYEKLASILTALDEGLPVLERLSTRDAPPHAPIWDIAVQIAWAVAQEALQVLGRPVGTIPTSVAVQFTALAAQRMGFETAHTDRDIKALGQNLEK